MNKKRYLRLTALLLAALLAFSALPGAAMAADGDVVLTIIHTNDRHGRMDSDPYIASIAKQVEGPVLILDAGDTLHGQTTTNLTEGESMVELMNAVGYSAMVPGNHDFNFGVPRLLELSEMMEFPLLAANVKDSGGKSLFQAYEIFEEEGITVGVFGLVTPETLTSADPRIVGDLVFEDPVKTAELMVAALKGEGCELIIALTHMGVDGASEVKYRSDTLAKVPGVDIVIDGHSHTYMDEGLAVGEALIVQTGAFAEHIGVVTVTASGDKLTKNAKNVDFAQAESEGLLLPDEGILNIIAGMDAEMEGLTGIVVGNTPVLLQGEREFVRKEETNLANLITDSMRWATGADVAFLGGGNIRASIPAGDITMGQVLTVLPFSNLLTTVELKGSDLLKVLEHGVSAYPELSGGHIQISGLSFTFDPNAQPGSRVRTVTMPDGGSLNPDKPYTVATIDFIAAGGDGYTMLTNGTNLKYFGGDVEALVDYLATKPVIKSVPDGRISVASSESGSELYIVQRGDNLSSIAEKYGTTWHVIYGANKGQIKNPNLIYPGQQLLIEAA